MREPRAMHTIKRVAATCLLLTVCAAPAAAQRAPAAPQKGTAAAKAKRVPGQGFIAINAGLQAAPTDVTDELTFLANAEAGTIEARYPSKAPLLLDASVGFRFWGRIGVAAGVSRAAASGTVSVRASVPHPLFDNQDRVVEGEAPDAARTETAAHLQLFYEFPAKSKWRARVFAGPSYMTVEQDLVHEVTVNEAFPFDTATFRGAPTGRAEGSGVGFNVGADVSRMFSRRAGAGMLFRYTRASLDLNAPASRNVSTTAGGLQVGAGLRIAF